MPKIVKLELSSYVAKVKTKSQCSAVVEHVQLGCMKKAIL